jgi:hypothetical protein
MKSFSVFIIVAFLLLSSALLEGGYLYAAEHGPEAKGICFSVETAGQIEAELQRADNLREQIELYKQANAELEQQVKILREIAALQKQQVEASRQAVEDMKQIVKGQREMYEAEIKASKPGFIKRTVDALGFISLGVLGALILL